MQQRTVYLYYWPLVILPDAAMPDEDQKLVEPKRVLQREGTEDHRELR